MNKTLRMAKALKAETIRRLPYILIALVIVFGAELVKLNYKTAEGVQIAKDNTANSRLLLQKVAALSEANRELSQQNNRLARRNAAHIDCIATLFARYTHDQRPITITDLNTCQAVTGEATPYTTPAPSTPKANNNKNLSTPASKNQGNPSLQPTSTPPAPEPGAIQGGPVCLLLLCIKQQVL